MAVRDHLLALNYQSSRNWPWLIDQREVEGRSKSAAKPIHAIAVGVRAVGLTEHLKRFGLRIPGDVSVIACDEMPLAAHLHPPANDRFAPGPLTSTVYRCWITVNRQRMGSRCRRNF